MLVVRPARKGDGRGVAEVFNAGIRAGIGGYTGSNHVRTAKDVRRFDMVYAAGKRHEFAFVAVDGKTKRVVGSCSFFAKEKGRTRHMGGMSWFVHPDYVRNGIATKLLVAVLREAKKRGFKKAEAEAAIENKASVRLAKKLGFKVEGRKRAGLLMDNGRYVDTYIFGMLLR
jgi:RimJ/RimL family protein N-acetyltransferase